MLEDDIKEFHKFLFKKYIPKQQVWIQKHERQYLLDKSINVQDLEQNFDEKLEECLLLIRKDVEEAEKKIIDNYWKELDSHKFDYPNLHQTFKKLSNSNKKILDNMGNYDVGDEYPTIIRELAFPLSKLFQSLEQSRKSRAGKTFELLLEHSFDKLNLRFQTQKALGKERSDFVCPDINHVKKDKPNAMVMECQTTLKDRFRLTLGKVEKQIRTKKETFPTKLYLLTATGRGIYTKSDSQDITDNKIQEILDNHKNNYLVIFSDVKKEFHHLGKDDNGLSYIERIFSFSEFLEEFRKNQKSWEISV